MSLCRVEDMYLSTEMGFRLSRSCIRQHVSLLGFRISAAGFGDARRPLLGTNEVRKECPVLTESYSCKPFSREVAGRFFSTKNPGYGVVCGIADEGMLFKEENASEKLERRRLVLYSKPGCCLCDALKEKLHLAFMLGGENDLSDIELEVRDITTNEEWEKLYQYEIPVLRRLRADASEETIPRFSPRLTVDQLQRKLAAALNSKE